MGTMTLEQPSTSTSMTVTGEDRCQNLTVPENQNTLRKTLVDVRLLNSYLSSIGETRQIYEIKLDKLDCILADFIVSVRKKNGDEFEPSSLRGILGSIDRWLRRHKYGHSIFQGTGNQFKKTKDSLKAKQKQLKEEGKGNRPNRTEAPTEEELNKLYECGAIGLQDPAALIHMLFFNISIYFGLSPKEQYDLKWGDVKLHVDSSGLEYLEYWERQRSSNGVDVHDIDAFRLRMYTNPNPERDPIKAYKMYSNQRPPDMQNSESPFYIAPNYMYNPSYSLWYRNMRIGKSTLRAMAKLVKQMDTLTNDNHFTGHSPNEASIQELVEICVPPMEVPQLSGNRNLQNINNCSELSDGREYIAHIQTRSIQNSSLNATVKPNVSCFDNGGHVTGNSHLEDTLNSSSMYKQIKEEPQSNNSPNKLQVRNLPLISQIHKGTDGVSAHNTSGIMSSTIQSILELHKSHGDIHVHIHDSPPQTHFKCIIIRSECDDD
ncbi:hypothetical protein chiPu_0006727 [Chiloscyllium punctatum]|uniref:ZMYM2-like/QRICH1 C-terminal domain-containing protein n=1 Tax=Chiloscyllium punctatum TaxID=137246 RepID=A0A401SD29_CHIPU|nr:hypothetical protein [Chiloscyllium punctatum]